MPSREIVTIGGVVKPHPYMSTNSRRAPGFPDQSVLLGPVLPVQVTAQGAGLDSPLGDSMMGLLVWIAGRKHRRRVKVSMIRGVWYSCVGIKVTRGFFCIGNLVNSGLDNVVLLELG